MAEKLRSAIVVLTVIALITALSACAEKERGSDEAENPQTMAAELSDAEMDSLMKQVAESEIDKECEEYLRDEVFANAEVFGIERDGNKGTAFVFLNEEEFVVLKDKAQYIGQ